MSETITNASGAAAPGPAPLRGRSVLVTGAASGIGLAIARRLGAAGAAITLCDLPGERLDAAVSQVPGPAVPRAVDLSRREQVASLAEELTVVDILVNNAGLQRVAPVQEMPVEAWDTLIEIMLTVPFLLARAVLPHMYERGFGRVINVASVHGLVASPYKSAYVSAKHGLLGLTKAMALEAAERSPGVSVHAVCPSYVRTPLVESQVADQARIHGISPEEVLERVLLVRNAVRRLIEPDEVAGAVEMLCGESAWTMTGSALTLDAGWLAH